MVVRYSIGWSGRVARGREVMGLSVGGLGRAGEVSKGERAAAAAVRACMLVGVLSDIRISCFGYRLVVILMCHSGKGSGMN